MEFYIYIIFNFLISRNSSISSNNEDDIDNSIHSHTAPPFLMSPAESKLFSTPGSFNFSMAALAADPAALAGTIHTTFIASLSLNDLRLF